MVLFGAAFRRDSVFFLRFFFLSQSEISPDCRLKYPYSCFSSHFCFLVIVFLLILVLFLVDVISLFYLFM